MVSKGLFWTGLFLFLVLGVFFPNIIVPGNPVQTDQGDVLYTIVLGVCLWGVAGWTLYCNPDEREVEMAKDIATDDMYTHIVGGVLIEESLFRGLIPATLIILGLGGVTSFVLAGIGFVVIHFIGDIQRLKFPQLVYLSGTTIILISLTLLTGTILPAIGVHFANNVMVMRLYSKEPICQA